MNTLITLPRWYVLSACGIATLCADEADAKATAAQADSDWPKDAPHRAVNWSEHPAAPRPAQPTWSKEQWELLHFLYGAGEFDGVWFEQKHPTEEGAFWWRNHLRRLFGDAPQPAQPEPATPLTDEQIAAAMPGGIYDSLNDPWDCGVGDGDTLRSIKADVIRIVRAVEAALEAANKALGA